MIKVFFIILFLTLSLGRTEEDLVEETATAAISGGIFGAIVGGWPGALFSIPGQCFAIYDWESNVSSLDVYNNPTIDPDTYKKCKKCK